jgi:succinoglycan biosynthesis transport protein ExoP
LTSFDHGPAYPAWPAAAEPPPFQWLPLLLAFVRRRWRAIALCSVAATAAAATYVATATPSYTATTTILIDSRRPHPFRQEQGYVDQQAESAFVESQVEILRSAGVAAAVVRELGLADSPEFVPPSDGRPAAAAALDAVSATVAGLGAQITPLLPPSVTDAAASAQAWLAANLPEPVADAAATAGAWVAAAVSLPPAAAPAPADTPRAREAVATEALLKATTVRRIGLSYTIDVGVRTRNAEQSARIANAIAEAYMATQLRAVSDITRRSGDWMQDRIRELHDQALAADRAVHEYKTRNGLVSTNGGLLHEQQLNDLSAQLSRARAERSQIEANWQRATALGKAGGASTELADVLGSQTITRLREREVDAARRLADIVARQGTGHPDRRAAEADIAAARGQIAEEARRVVASLGTLVQAARAREAEMSRQMAQMTALVAERNSDRVELSALERMADAYRRMHEDLLRRYTQAVQEQTFPIADARVVTAATPPLQKSHPRSLLTLGAGSVLGLCLGFVFAFARDTMDRGLRTPAQVRAATGLDCVAQLPRLRGRRRTAMLQEVVAEPLSPFSEAVRAAALRVVHQHLRAPDVKVIGCVSAVPGGGASTLAANLAQCLAQAGHRTVLLDWDLRKLGLTRALVSGERAGFVEVVDGAVPLEEALWTDPRTGLRFMAAAGAKPTRRHPTEILGSERARAILAELRSDNDFVIVDLPAFSAGVDSHAAQRLVDSFLMAVEWGGVHPSVLVETLARLDIGGGQITGAVLNKVDAEAQRRYAMAEMS